MKHFFNIWKLEFRKQRFALLIALFVLLGMILLVGLNHLWRFQEKTFLQNTAVVLAFFTFLTISVNAAGRESRKGISALELSFPMKPIVLFLAKYTYSLCIFAFGVALTICIFHIPAWNWNYLIIGIPVFLFLHSVFWFWNLFSDELKGFLGLGAIPVVSFCFLPLFGFFYTYTQNETILLFLFAASFMYGFLFHFLFSILIWNRKFVRDESTMKSGSIYLILWISLPLLMWSIPQCYSFFLCASYIKQIHQKYNGILPGEKLSIQENLLQFNEIEKKQGRETAIRNLLENKERIDVPYQLFDFFQIKSQSIREILRNECRRAIKNRDNKRILFLTEAALGMDHFEDNKKAKNAASHFLDLLQDFPPDKATVSLLRTIADRLRMFEYGKNKRRTHKKIYEDMNDIPLYLKKGSNRWTTLLQIGNRKRASAEDIFSIRYLESFTLSFIQEKKEIQYLEFKLNEIFAMNHLNCAEDFIRYWITGFVFQGEYSLRYIIAPVYRIQSDILEKGKPSLNPNDFLTHEEIILFQKYQTQYKIIKEKDAIENFYRQNKAGTAKVVMRINHHKTFNSSLFIGIGHLWISNCVLNFYEKNGTYIYRPTTSEDRRSL